VLYEHFSIYINMQIINNRKEAGDHMLTCKKCGTPLAKPIPECPICHEKEPAGPVPSSVGQDYTETYNPVEPNYELVRQKTRKIAAILAFTIGFTGAPLFYLLYKRTALWWLFTAIILIALCVVLWPLGLYSYLIIAVMVLCQAGLGAYILMNSNLKDGRGELLK